MSLFQRMKTTAAADAHGVVDALEDRALLLKQYVREAEAEPNPEGESESERASAHQPELGNEPEKTATPGAAPEAGGPGTKQEVQKADEGPAEQSRTAALTLTTIALILLLVAAFFYRYTLSQPEPTKQGTDSQQSAKDLEQTEEATEP